MTLFQIPGVIRLIQTELPADVKKKNLVDKMENLFVTSSNQEYVTQSQRNSEEFVDRIWLYTSLLDAALGEREYHADKFGIEKEWETAVRFLKYDLGRRKLFSGLFLRDVAKLLSMAGASLQCLNPSSCGQSLVGWVQKYGESLSDLYDTISTLKVRLDKLTYTYQDLQGPFPI